MDAKQIMYAEYDKFLKDNRIEGNQGMKFAFVEGYFQGMKFAANIAVQGLKQEIKEDR